MSLARLFRARLTGEAVDALPAARILLTPVPEAVGAAAGVDHRTLTLLLLGGAQLWSGDLDEAATHLDHVNLKRRRGYEPAPAVAGDDRYVYPLPLAGQAGG